MPRKRGKKNLRTHSQIKIVEQKSSDVPGWNVDAPVSEKGQTEGDCEGRH